MAAQWRAGMTSNAGYGREHFGICNNPIEYIDLKMRKKIVAGNWKMNTTLTEAVALATSVEQAVRQQQADDVVVVICPPFLNVADVVRAVDTKRIGVGVQNCSNEEKGAFTGEISAEMIKAVGADYVILGHSERRIYQKEDNALLNKKTELALKHNLTPIFCIGELLEEREAGKLFDVVKSQLAEGLFDLDAQTISKIVIAYEPVWAIGTGVTASPEQAQEMHAYIRQLLTEKYGKSVADEISVLYGGSCNSKNAKEIFSKPDVDGGLIGGASLKAEDFSQIIGSF